jgi:hypothetical protein
VKLKISFLALLCLVVFSYGLDDLARPYAYATRDTIKAYKLDSNEVRLYNGHNKLLDSLDLKFARYTRFKDTTFDSLKAKFVRAADSIVSTKGVFSGRVNVDSLTSAKGVYCTKINTGLGNFEIGQDLHTSSDVIFDSLAARIAKFSYGIIADTITADSIHTRSLNTDSSITTAKTLSADSVFSTKGVAGAFFDGACTGAANTGNTLNVLNGYQALLNNAGDYNVANGYRALTYNTSGTGNTGIGYQSLQAMKTGTYNTCVGYVADIADTSGSANVAIGGSAMSNNKRGDNNVAIGYNTGSSIVTYSFTTCIGTNSDAVKDTTLNLNILQVRKYNDSASAYGDGIRSGAVYRIGGQLMIMY